MLSDKVLYPKYFSLLLIFSVLEPVFPQDSKDFLNTTFLKKLNRDVNILHLHLMDAEGKMAMVMIRN